MQVAASSQDGLIQRVLFKSSKGINVVGLFLLPVMMFLTTADVILRYFFNRPIIGSVEVTEFMVALMAALGFAYVGMRRDHIIVSTVVERFAPRVRIIIDTITGLASGIFISLVSWRMFVNAAVLRLDGRVTATLNIPMWPVYYLVALGFFILGLVFIYNALGPLFKVLGQSRKRAIAAILLIILVGVAVFAAPVLPWHEKASPTSVGLIGIILLLVLLFTGMPIGVVMGLIGFLGMVYVIGPKAGLTNIGVSPYTTIATYTLSIIPLFVLMGEFCFHSGITGKLYDAAYKWLGRLPGGLAIATVGACAGFACVTGSSVATVATIGSVAFPEMKRYQYDMKLATGCIAAASGLGILIPPSMALALYGIIAGESIGKLFLAGFLPGIVQASFFFATILIICRRNPLLGPKGESSTIVEKFASLKDSWSVMLLFMFVIGGLYLGIFTPMEAAGIGAFGAFLIALVIRKLTWKVFLTSIRSTVNLSSMALFLLIGASIFGYFLAVTRLPFELSSFVSGLPVDRHIILALILAVYAVLGCFIASLAMIVLTVPVFLPMIIALGFDPVWFGVMVTVMCEVAVITPPVGINVFVLRGIAKDIPMYTIFGGTIPFLIADLFFIILLVVFPQIALFLPNLMK